MKKLLVAVSMLMLLTGTAHAETIKVSVNGLVCSFCATGIKKTFSKLPEVDDVVVDLDKRLVTVRTKNDQTIDDAKMTALITDAGYTVTDIKREK